MAFPEYRLASYRSMGVHESERWSYSVSSLSPLNDSLENEITDLRRKMEQLVRDEMSFTSREVIELSSRLDQKINEYMKQQYKKH